MQQKHHDIFLHYHLKYIRLLTTVLLTKNLIFCHVPTWYWSCWDIRFEDNFCQIKNRSNILILCIYSVSQPKMRENVKKIQFLANDIMLWHLPFKWLLETGEAKTCKLDQYAYRSCWDISLRDFNQNLMEVKPEKSQI